MAGQNVSFTPVFGKRLRITRLDNCGMPPAAATADSNIVTSGFVTVSLSAEVEDGNEIIVRNAAGQICINERMSSNFKRFNVEIAFCGVNPALLEMTTNANTYKNAAGDSIGLSVPEGALNKAFAMELWTGMAGQACATGSDEASGYMLLPYVGAGVLGDLEIGGEDAINFSMTGAYTKGGNGWGTGPYKVVYGGSTTNEVQTVTITGVPTGGTFTLTFKGQTTSAIAYNAASTAVQTALTALSTVGTGNAVVGGGPGPGTPYSVTFQGTLGGADQPALTATGSLTGGTTPTVTVTTPTAGTSGVASKLPVAVDDMDHLLLISTGLALPPAADATQPMPT